MLAGWLKTQILGDSEFDLRPDFHLQPQSGFRTIAVKDGFWLGKVCAPTDSWLTWVVLQGVAVWPDIPGADMLPDVIAEAQAMGATEALVHAARVECEDV